MEGVEDETEESRSLVRKAAVAFDRVRGDALPRDASRDLVLKVADEQWKILEWRWRKSSYSGNGGSNCVEVGTHGASPATAVTVAATASRSRATSRALSLSGTPRTRAARS